jgi:hypothetical protein
LACRPIFVEALLKKMIFYLNVTKMNRNCSLFFISAASVAVDLFYPLVTTPSNHPHPLPHFLPPPTSFTSDRGIRFPNLHEVGSLAGVNNLLHVAVCLFLLLLLKDTNKNIF